MAEGKGWRHVVALAYTGAMDADSPFLCLVSATSRQDLDGMAEALAQGADPDKFSGSGMTPLGMLAQVAHRSTTRAAMELLIERGANINQSDLQQRTAVAWAARTGRLENLLILLDLGADPWACDREGQTPLDWAVLSWNVECAETLVRHAGLSQNGEDAPYERWARMQAHPEDAEFMRGVLSQAAAEWQARRLDQETVGATKLRTARL